MAGRTAPKGMSTAARKLWRETVSAFDLDEHEYPVLEAVCRKLDIIERIRDELEGADLVVRGSQGQDAAHPLLSELRMQEASYAALLKSLDLPGGDGVEATPRTLAAQKAANARWSRGA